MESFGVVFRPGDLPLKVDHPKRKGCGKGGKWWYWLRSFTLKTGRSYIVGVFGSAARPICTQAVSPFAPCPGPPGRGPHWRASRRASSG